MRLPRHTTLQHLTLAWIVALSIVAGALAPAWHVLAGGGAAVPSLEVCTAQGMQVVVDDSAPTPVPSATQHCVWCLTHVAGGPPPAERSLPTQVVAAQPLPAAPTSPAPRPEPWRHAAPRGPPAAA